METNSEPATGPAKATTPSAAARTAVPTGAAMSMPRCPAPKGPSGSSNERRTGPSTGQVYIPYSGPACTEATPDPTAPVPSERPGGPWPANGLTAAATLRATAILNVPHTMSILSFAGTVAGAADTNVGKCPDEPFAVGATRPDRRDCSGVNRPPLCGSDRCATR